MRVGRLSIRRGGGGARLGFIFTLTFGTLGVRAGFAALSLGVVVVLVAAAAAALTLRSALFALVILAGVRGYGVIREVVSGELVVFISLVIILLVNVHGVLGETAVAVVLHFAFRLRVLLLCTDVLLRFIQHFGVFVSRRFVVVAIRFIHINGQLFVEFELLRFWL